MEEEQICFGEDDDDTEDVIVDKEGRQGTSSSVSYLPPPGGAASSSRHKLGKNKSQQEQRRRRRRSSARFLRLGDANHDVDGDDDDDEIEHVHTNSSQQQLGEMYKQAIRLNAENRINAANSWSLSLIDHLDRLALTTTSSSDDMRPTNKNTTNNSTNVPNTETTLTSGVNFTKASCSLDASVKIYSYRVDDVHLTSYKVLANLNRTETDKKSTKTKLSTTAEVDETEEVDAESNKKASSSREKQKVETIEQNLANINMSKLDKAFDIDPLFHKMSKAFDEGGAKGLLLANLGVGTRGCNIVFDSKEDEEEEKMPESDISNLSQNGMLNVSTLTEKLDSLLDGQSISSVSLVPQLVSLRAEHAELEEEGFVDDLVPVSRSRRYACSQAEEDEADKSIHYEALERSRVSQGDLGRSELYFDKDDNDDISHNGGFAPDDFGGGDEDDDFGSGNMMESFFHDGDHRFSSASFRNSSVGSGVPTPKASSQSQASILLDALSSGDIANSQSIYEFFNSQALEKLSQGTTWAGAAHWKKIAPRRATTATPAKTPRKTPKKSTKKKKTERVVVDLTNCDNLDMEDLLRQPPKKKRGTNPLQLTKAAITKHSKTDNLLPTDIGLDVAQLSTLFLRPNANLCTAEESVTPVRHRKTVGFGPSETFGWSDSNNFGAFDDGVDDDYNNDDGPAFTFADTDDNHQEDYVVQDLEGVRKVEKVRVGYAKVAKKVDVKRLKKDLWLEIEQKFAGTANTTVANTTFDMEGANNNEVKVDDDVNFEESKFSDDADTSHDDMGKVIHHKPLASDSGLSFSQTVQEMQMTQSQPDVTLPFYFICVLHLANEKGLALNSMGLEDFIIQSS